MHRPEKKECKRLQNISNVGVKSGTESGGWGRINTAGHEKGLPPVVSETSLSARSRMSQSRWLPSYDGEAGRKALKFMKKVGEDTKIRGRGSIVLHRTSEVRQGEPEPLVSKGARKGEKKGGAKRL